MGRLATPILPGQEALFASIQPSFLHIWRWIPGKPETISIGYRLKACECLLDRDLTGAQEELTAANELVDHALKDVWL